MPSRLEERTGAGDAIVMSMFSTERYDPPLRLEAARAYTSPFFELMPLADCGPVVEARSISFFLHDLVLNETTYGPMRMERADRRRLASQHEFVTVWLILEGRQDGIIDGSPFRTRAGELHLFDGAPAMRLVSARPHVLSAHVPYGAIGFDPSCHPPHLQVPADTATCHVVAATLRALRDKAPAIRAGEARELSRGLCSLLRSAFGLDAARPPEPHVVDGGRALAMRAFLDGRLQDRSVGIGTLCRRFNVSRATVYRLFAEHGGVESYLRQRRLERAFADLAAASPRRGLVRRVGERWGFDDPSHFHRRFRERYGMSPVEALWLGEAAAGADEAHRPSSAPATPVFGWLARAGASSG